MALQDIFSLVTIGSFFALAALERFLPGYDYPSRTRWALRGVVWLVVALAVATAMPLLTDGWLAEHALLDLSGWGWWGALPGLVVFELAAYGWHRALHGVPALWRLHQWHHASERNDIWSANRFHPLDAAGWAVVGSVCAVGLLGLATEAALLLATVVAVIAWFGHANLRTPRWLGYIVARPESHALHHARDAHHGNYADLPVVDMLFGTFENPENAPAQVGFFDGASDRVGALLIGKDVSAGSTQHGHGHEGSRGAASRRDVSVHARGV